MNSNKTAIRELKKIVNYYKKLSASMLRVDKGSSQNYSNYLEIIRGYLNDFANLVSADFNNALTEYSSNHIISEETKRELYETIENDGEIMILRFEIHVFYRLSKMKAIKEVKVNSFDDVPKSNSNEGVFWYRGQSNSDWALVPSFFRNSKKSYLCDWSCIYKDYESKPKGTNLIKKLKEVNVDTIYRTTAFIQHSIGYSPLIDFTKSPNIAMSFALSNFKSMVEFYGANSCVYQFNIGDSKILTNCEEIDEVLEKISISILKENESIIKLIQNGRWKNFLNNQETSVVHLIDYPTNDRMLFQKGTFVLYDKVIIIGNNVYMSFGKAEFLESRMKKYIIETKVKEDIFMILMNESPQYHPRYLYDPYLYLSEPDK